MDLSHLSRKDKYAAKVGHPESLACKGRKATAGPSTPLKYASLRMTGRRLLLDGAGGGCWLGLRHGLLRRGRRRARSGRWRQNEAVADQGEALLGEFGLKELVFGAGKELGFCAG